MDHHNKEHRQSSLPESLIPHLYDGPRQTELLPSQQFQTGLPLPAVPGPSSDPMTRINSPATELPSMRSSFQLPSMAPSLLRPLSENSRVLPPPRLSARPVAMLDTSFTARPHVDISPSAIVHPMGTMSLPTQYGQHFAATAPPEPTYGQSRHVENRYPPRDPALTLPAPRPTPIHRDSWREGEAGPSSLPHTSHSFDAYRGRRGSSQPAQAPRHADFHAHRGASDDEYEINLARIRAGEAYEPGLPESISPTQYGHYTDRPSVRAPPQERTPYVPEETAPYHLPPIRQPSRTWSGTPTPGYPYGETAPAAGQSPGSFSEMSSEGGVTEEGADDNASSRSKRRKQEEPQRKEKNTRKTAVACNFCRGRKLRCNGAKPACSNCILRKFECEYVPVQRRRGPGKAPKGSKLKKNTGTGQQPAASTSTTDLGGTEASSSLSAARGRSLQPEDPTPSSRRRGREHTSQPPSSPERDTDGEK